MKITFVLPVVNLLGGIRVIVAHAQALRERGHEVFLVSPPPKKKTLKQRVKHFVRYREWPKYERFPPSHVDGTDLEHKVLDVSRPVDARDVPDADVIIATFWETAEWVEKMPASKGVKVYFVQGHEVHPGQPVDRVEATLRNSFHKIVVSEWIRDILINQYGQENISLVPNGVDLGMFYSETRKKNKKCVFGFLHSDKQFKGSDLAIEAIEIARANRDFDVVAFGGKKPDLIKIPSYIKFFENPDQDFIRKIYAMCDAWLFTSRREGFGLPLLEAMSCRTPVIATRAGAAPDLVRSDNGYLVAVDDVKGIADAICDVCDMTDERWQKMSLNAYKTAKDHDWDSSFSRFEKVLKDVVKNSSRV